MILKMKQFKLKVHTRDFSTEDLVINPKDFPDIKIKDVLEIYHQDGTYSRLLLQVTERCFKEDFSQNTISVEQSVATAFQLRKYDDVNVNPVSLKSVALDSLEITFKDQYLERSDMWRLKTNLEGAGVYLGQKLEFWGIRFQVYEMWAQGERVACGTVSYNTKIVFRSCTNLIYLFIQMSSEMWDMDIFGYLYFEKAINGFLTDLFNEWKTKDTSHEVTIVLFSRTFYEAQLIDEFPKHMHSCLQRDYKGRFYEDFYRVAVQNERYEDWKVILVNLKKSFNSYRDTVLKFHHRPGSVIPKAVNSTAAQGNFLEVLNMSLNVFEKHYRDRSFDRTGHLSVVITPGVGVFEVDRELTNITKQRIIDNGVGSDLVCLGEQPLHAVPLFKFHSKNRLSDVDDYSMPHWTNLSFYSYPKQYSASTFIPRIKLPQKRSIKTTKEKQKPNDYRELPSTVKPMHKEEFPSLVNAFDYDQYDANVFNYLRPGSHTSRNSSISQKVHSRKRNDTHSSSGQPHAAEQIMSRPLQTHYRKFSETDICMIQMEMSKSLSRSAAMSIPRRTKEHSPLSSSLGGYILDAERMTPMSTFGSYDDNSSPPSRPTVGSVGSAYGYLSSKTFKVKPGRALINPFDPSHVTIKLTSNRRRWTHVFPLGPKGIFMQQHHYQAVPQSDNTAEESVNKSQAVDKSSPELHHLSNDARRRKTSSISNHPVEGVSSIEKDTKQGMAHSFHSLTYDLPLRIKGQVANSHQSDNSTDKYTTLLWGATGEQDWTPSLTTGVDWKSCTVPACLPITTDYFPDKRSIHHDYVVTDYELILDCVASDVPDSSNNGPLKALEVFRELICQRLQQGFQIIVHPHVKEIWLSGTPGRLVSSSRQYHEEYFLSIGRIFHRLMLGDGVITLQYLKPRHPYPTIHIKYLYRFMAQHSETYEIYSVDFTTEKLENFIWNYMDHYICTRGEGDYALKEPLKYSRIRLFVLPAFNLGTKRIQEGSKYCDVYEDLAPEFESQLLECFTQFANHINKIRKGNLINLTVNNAIRERAGTVGRAACTRRGGLSNAGSYASGSGSGPSMYRERADSNRLERPRPRNTKPVERIRSESGNGGRGTPTAATATAEMTEFKPISSSSLSLDTGTDNYGTIKDGIEDSGSSASTPRLLTMRSPLDEIIEAIKHPHDGVHFINKHNTSSPYMLFVSYDAVKWALDHVEDVQTVDDACSLFEMLLSNKKICHNSGDSSHAFIYGYYIYRISLGDDDSKSDSPSAQPYSEVAYHRSSNCLKNKGPAFLQPDIAWPQHYTKEDGNVENNGKYYSVPLYKTSYTVIPNTGSDREEWGHLRYHGNYMPSAAFEMVFQWLAATGSYVTDLILKGWARRASTSGLLLLPMHSDPFAQLFSNQFDPLRGTIFIPLTVECIMDNKLSHPFSVFKSETWDYRLFLFQEAIVRRFGFLSCQYSPFVFDTKDNCSKHQQYQPQYVHITGHAMIMISLKVRDILNRKFQSDSNKSKLLSTTLDGIVSSPHEEYITRHVTGQVNRKSLQLQEADCRVSLDNSVLKVGFFWSWNYTLSKRWKTQSSGDYIFKILNDFRAFCSNGDNRLREFWERSKTEMLEATEAVPLLEDDSYTAFSNSSAE